MASIKVGDRYVDKVTGYPMTVTEVREHSIWLRHDFGEGKCCKLVNMERVKDALSEYTPPKE